MSYARARFEVLTWTETPLDASAVEPRLTRVTVTKRFDGDVKGESALEMLMVYRRDGCATFVGMERFEGTLGGRAGTFHLRHTGTFEDGTADAKWTIVPATGTGALEGVRGEGGFSSGPAEIYTAELVYAFD
jgi:hypothetical protein